MKGESGEAARVESSAQTFKQRHAVQDHILLELEPTAAFLNTISSSTSTIVTSRCSFFPSFQVSQAGVLL